MTRVRHLLIGVVATGWLLLMSQGGQRAAIGSAADLIGRFQAPTLEWAWNSGDVLPESHVVLGTPIVIDLDGDGAPEIVFVSAVNDVNRSGEGTLRAISGRDGSEVFSVTDPSLYLSAQNGLATGDIDGDGRPEIIGRTSADALMAFEHDGTYKWTSPNLSCWGNKAYPAIADVDRDGSPEIAICATLLNGDGTIQWQHRPVSLGAETTIADIDATGGMEVIDGRRVYSGDGSVLWEAVQLSECASAVANLDQDPNGEVIMIEEESLYIVDDDGTVKVGPVSLPRDEPAGVTTAGSPIIADVDGDGQPEIGVAGGGRYSVFERDGALKWSVPVGSFRFYRGASAADLDGNGAAEIVFHGPEGLTIFRGTDGSVMWTLPSPPGSSTFSANLPVVADVDADGNAEIVSNWISGSAAGRVPGIQVYGHESWKPTRPIWNQHSYHVTNVNDDGTIPRVEELNWVAHNNYRANERLQGAYPPRRVTYIPVALSEQDANVRPVVDVVIALDTSSSMAGTKLTSAKLAIGRLLDEIRWQQDLVALVSFNRTAELRQPLTHVRDEVEAALEAMAPMPGTRIDEGLRLARQELTGVRGRNESVSRAVVVLTDGLQESSLDKVTEEARQVQATGALLILVGLGPDIDLALLHRLAGPRGRVFVAPEPGDLADIYHAIGRTIACMPERYWGQRCG